MRVTTTTSHPSYGPPVVELAEPARCPMSDTRRGSAGPRAGCGSTASTPTAHNRDVGPGNSSLRPNKRRCR